MAQFARPDSDVTTASWTDAGTPLWSKLDDNSDADLIRHVAGSNSTCEVTLSNVTDPASSAGHVLRLRANKDLGVSDNVAVTARLQQGGVTKATLGTGNLTDVFQTFTHALSAAEADSITDYADLTVELDQAWTADLGLDPKAQVAWLELEVPDVAAAAASKSLLLQGVG